MFLVLMEVQKFGVADAASEDIQKRGRKMEEIRREKAMVRNSWVAQEDEKKLKDQGKGKSRSEM